jgi:hypothetical protein
MQRLSGSEDVGTWRANDVSSEVNDLYVMGVAGICCFLLRSLSTG